MTDIAASAYQSRGCWSRPAGAAIRSSAATIAAFDAVAMNAVTGAGAPW